MRIVTKSINSTLNGDAPSRKFDSVTKNYSWRTSQFEQYAPIKKRAFLEGTIVDLYWCSSLIQVNKLIHSLNIPLETQHHIYLPTSSNYFLPVFLKETNFVLGVFVKDRSSAYNYG